MGGKGSGRLNKTDAFLKQNSNPFNTVSGNLASVGNEVLVVPNHSGITSHPEFKNNTLFVKTAGDTMTGDLTMAADIIINDTKTLTVSEILEVNSGGGTTFSANSSNSNVTFANAGAGGYNLVCDGEIKTEDKFRGNAWQTTGTASDMDVNVFKFGVDSQFIIRNSDGTGVCDLTVDGAAAITGNITGGNVTSGADPGHTHTGASLSGIDISADTNLAVSSPVTLTGDTVGWDFSTNNNWTGTNEFDHVGISTPSTTTRSLVIAETYATDAQNIVLEATQIQSLATSNVIAAVSSTLKTQHTTGTMLLPLGYFGGSQPNSGGALTLCYGGLFGAEVQGTNTPTITNMKGVVGQVDVEDATVSTSVGVEGSVLIDTGSSTTSISVMANAPEGGTTTWGVYSQDDLQVTTGKKIILEGSPTVKGDTYLVYDSGGSTMDFFINNAEILNMSSTQAEFLKIIKTSGITGDVFAVSTDNTDPTAGGGAATGRIPIDVGGATKYIPYY